MLLSIYSKNLQFDSILGALIIFLPAILLTGSNIHKPKILQNFANIPGKNFHKSCKNLSYCFLSGYRFLVRRRPLYR